MIKLTQKRKILISLIVLISLFWVRPIMSQFSKREPDRMIVVLLDLSGSFRDYLRDSLMKIRIIISELKPGDRILIRALDDESWDNKNDALSFTIPKSNRPIDPRHRLLVKRIKISAIKLLEKLNIKQLAPKTDIYGAIYGAGLWFLRYQDFEKWLFIFTDLKENVHRRTKKIDLHDVYVRVLFVPHDKSIIEFHARVSKWDKIFKQAGAKDVEIYDVSESRAKTRFLEK